MDTRHDPTAIAEREALTFDWHPGRFNRRVGEIPRTLRAGPVDPNLISLAFGAPSPDLFPAAGLAEAARAALADPAAAAVALQYGQVYGNPVLAAELLKKLEHDESRTIPPDRLIITSGSGQAISAVTIALANPGDVCLLEAPTFMGTIRMVGFHGLDVVPVPVDDDGLDLDVLEAELRRLHAAGTRPRFLYTTPTFSNPTGVTMPLDRRQALLELALRYDLPVIEDDAYGDLRLDGTPVPTLSALDRHGLVIRLGTFSKIVAPGVRLGFVVADPALIQRVPPFKPEGSTNGLTSLIVGTFMRQGRLEPHIAELRRSYRARRDTMQGALAAHMPEGVRWTRPEGGFFFWLTLPPRLDVERMTAAAAEAGVVMLPGTTCFPDGRGSHHIRLSYSLESLDRLAEGVRRLGGAIRAGLA
jgi:DNA-binding transcriptional MocR family regulator